MRRIKDNWVNATQILKCCNFPKAKRTKILEKGVQQGVHEKIQGGYGRFQGTWVPLADAQQLAAEYGVTPAMAPVLYLDVSDPNLVIPKKAKQVNQDGTPVKRKYVKKAKKLDDTPTKKHKFGANDMYPQDAYRGLGGAAGVALAPNAQQMSHIQYQLQQQAQQLPLTLTQQQQLQHLQQSQPHALPPTFNQLDFMMQSGHLPTFGASNQAIQTEFRNYQLQYQRFQQQQQQIQQHQAGVALMSQHLPAPPPNQHKFFNPSGNNVSYGNFPHAIPAQQHQQLMGQFHHNNALSQSTNETNWSQDENNKELDTSLSSNEEGTNSKRGSQMPSAQNPKLYPMNESMNGSSQVMEAPMEDDENSYSAQLLRFFSEDNGEIPYFVHNPPFDFNINEAIDDEGHTPLHWSASIGNYTMIHLLMSKGANPLVVNNFGLNPLSKLVSFNNCFELKNFPKVLDDLELCLINTDINGRTPIHYLSQFAKVKSKYESLRYYLEIILGKLTSLSHREANKLANLLNNVINHQDVNGDTCLHLAAKSSATKFVKLLLSYGARDDLVNVNNETARQIIESYELMNEDAKDMRVPSGNPILATPMRSYGNKVETPDTQRTTVQTDELDDDEDSAHNTTAYVSREHLALLHIGDDDKKGVLQDNAKALDAISTPIGGGGSDMQLSFLNLQLPVITERTVENTPLRVPVLPQSSQPTEGHTQRDMGETSVISHEPKPPQLDDDGHIIEQSGDRFKIETHSQALPLDDLSSMIHVMVNSLAATYKEDTQSIEAQMKNARHQIAQNEAKKVSSLKMVNTIFARRELGEVDNLQDANKVVVEQIDSIEDLLKIKEQTLIRVLEKNQAYQLASVVQDKESMIEEQEDSEDKENEASVKRAVATELTKLQLKRSRLLTDMTNSVKFYGIDTKMYKYRKLISLSCGLKMEDIDGLIDGIEESLMQGS